MKVLTILIIIQMVFSLVSLASLARCSYIEYLVDAYGNATNSWQTVTISAIGSFRVPEEWNVEEKDGFLYITDIPLEDGGYTIYLVGAPSWTGIESESTHPHELFEGMEKGGLVRSQIFSFPFHGVLCVFEYTVNGIKEEYYLISMTNHNKSYNTRFDLLVWNRDIIDERFARQIALTFVTDHVNPGNPNVGQLET